MRRASLYSRLRTLEESLTDRRPVDGARDRLAERLSRMAERMPGLAEPEAIEQVLANWRAFLADFRARRSEASR